jgi:hypothetical protein
MDASDSLAKIAQNEFISKSIANYAKKSYCFEEKAKEKEGWKK